MLRYYLLMEISNEGALIEAQLFTKSWPDCWMPPKYEDEEAYSLYQDILYDQAEAQCNLEEEAIYNVFETTPERLKEMSDELEKLQASLIQCHKDAELARILKESVDNAFFDESITPPIIH